MKKRTLYKLTSTGKTQVWTIWTEGNVIFTEHGQIDGQKIISKDTIKLGKNIGSVSETTPEQQAEKEAISKWEHKRKKDYRDSIKDIGKMGDTKESKEGGYLPMLAHTYEQGKMEFPCLVQPKLDGLRCIAKKNEGKVSLWFRSGKRITTMKHIEDQLNKVMKNEEIFDGELYSHSIEFENICGLIRRDKHIQVDEASKIEYHLYDCPKISGLTEADSFEERQNFLEKRLSKSVSKNLVLVETKTIDNEKDIKGMHDKYVKKGFEGIILRKKDMPYEQKRSKNLLKYKEFEDDEFKIIDYVEGRGNLMGCVGSFVCEFRNPITKKIDKFEAKLMGAGVTERLRQYLNHPEKFMNKQLTVKFQGFTEKGVPRFPVGKSIRFDK